MTEDKNKYILSINGMSKSFGRNKVLKHIDLNVKPGTIMGLMGENGAGKSTMMKCLFGTYQKDEGVIILDGKEVNFSGPKEALENGVAMVHQELNQCLERSVIDNLFLGRYPKNSLGVVDEGRMKKEASDLFRKLGITVNLTQPMKRMSVSKRQMCEIAKAISYNSKVIVLDEPTSSLTVQEVEKLFEMMRMMRLITVIKIFRIKKPLFFKLSPLNIYYIIFVLRINWTILKLIVTEKTSVTKSIASTFLYFGVWNIRYTRWMQAAMTIYRFCWSRSAMC